ncbi:MAG TPA: histone H1-like repetitive region-containing protein, partial [Jatrophihabitans sp.]|nr:histone H1-like repetitive region-containing protein [Jatrophihabitans sp.]
TAAKKSPAKKTAARKAPAKKTAARKAPAKKTAAKNTAAKKTPAKKTATGKTAARKTAAKKTATKTAARKAPARKTAATSAPVAQATSAPAAPPVTGGPPASATAVKTLPDAPASGVRDVAVPAGSEWTQEELAEVRQQLVDELTEMRSAYDSSMRELDDLQRSSTDGAGDDQADAGSKTFEREQEQSIAANRFDLITQIQHAVERIDTGTYGFCESCGKPIPKARLKAFPAATLDVACKQREERR